VSRIDDKSMIFYDWLGICRLRFAQV